MNRSVFKKPWRGRTGSALALVLTAVLLFSAHPAVAGSGRVNNNGTIDVTINIRFPPTAADITEIQNQATAASHVLWDASEGQLRFGAVTLNCGAVNEDLADMWVFPQGGRAGTGFNADGSRLAQPGAHVTQFLPSSTGVIVAHEFGHLALGLGDEYDEQNRFGACWGFGRCTEPGALSEQNHCLMQQPDGFTQTEFCTQAAHDLVRGEGTPCTGAAPCTTNCQFFNPGTGRYETSQQTAVSNRSCWEQLVANSPSSLLRLACPMPPSPAVSPGPLSRTYARLPIPSCWCSTNREAWAGIPTLTTVRCAAMVGTTMGTEPSTKPIVRSRESSSSRPQRAGS